MRARRLLVRAAIEGRARMDLSRFFAPAVAERITTAVDRIRPGEAAFRDAAIMFVDIRGFTTLAHSSAANAVIAVITDYQSRMVPVIQGCGGSIDKFLGDGILATFGAAMAAEAPVADAFRAAEGLLAAADAWSADRVARGDVALRIGVGLAAGRVLFGAVGDENQLEYTVIGDPVNLAAKLEKHTKAEGCRVLAPADALTLARQQGYAPTCRIAALGARGVGGVAEPIDLVSLER
ncbi:MAG: adenylate/guanylate cyclase domain-containing protein [Alphaproteobacteria bacterium]|nr:adenylate/guanylate cyclase domain-containing protein [Alphaproteobacteria bacterium]